MLKQFCVALNMKYPRLCFGCCG